MTTIGTRPTTSRMERANAERWRRAGAKATEAVVKWMRWLDDATLARLIEAAQFEALIRAQGRTTDDDAGGTT